jgi:hypothetical protein
VTARRASIDRTRNLANKGLVDAGACPERSVGFARISSDRQHRVTTDVPSLASADKYRSDTPHLRGALDN